MILKALNPVFLALLVLLGIGLQTSIFNSYPLMVLQPDIVLLAVIWVALRREFLEGGILTLFFSYAAELHSSAPQGLYLCTHMAVYLTLRGLSRYFLFAKLPQYITLALGASLFWKLFGLLFLQTLGLGAHQWRHTLALLFPGAVIQGLAGIWVFRLFEKLDWMTFKNPRAKHVGDDDVFLEEETLGEGTGF